ncbi:hypothetical protein D3C78_853350 [compost metagenome]
MDIPALSISMAQSSIQQAVALKMMSVVKEQAQLQGQNLEKLMSASLDPNLGKSLDIRV